MHVFLRKLSLVKTVREAILLSREGLVLLRFQGGEAVGAAAAQNPWPAILAGLGPVTSAEIRFSRGCYWLQATPVGLVAVGMAGDTALPSITKAVDNVGDKLGDAAMRDKVVRNLLPHVDEAGRHALQATLAGSEAIAGSAPLPTTGSSPAADGEEREIRAALESGDKRRAIVLVMEQIAACSRGRRFEQAERLRDWLLEIDPMALVEGIRAAELIEEEKAAAIGPELQATWQDLLKSLSREEFAALYHAAAERGYADGEVVVRQGEFQATLFLVNSGQVQVSTEGEGRQILLRSYGPGEILGGETFFDASVWTVNAVSRGASLSAVPRARLVAMKENHPALYGKLQDYCGRYPSTGMLFQKSRRTRRVHERRKAQGRVGIDLLDAQGKETGLTAKGELIDLSRGGVALSLRFSQKKNAAALLGQLIRVHLRPKTAAQPLVRTGKVMAVRCHDFVGNEYSLHIHFQGELSGNEVLQLTAGTR